MGKLVHFSREAREGFVGGINKLANAVTVTLGPTGRTVLLDRQYGPPVATKDGVTVAKDIEVGDTFERIAVELLKDAARTASEGAGDGTTMAIVLGRAILVEGVKLVAAGHDPMALKRGIDKGLAAVLERLREISKPGTSRDVLVRAATIAANGDAETGKLVGEAAHRIGKEGVFSVEDGRSLETTVEYVEGYDIDRGYLSPHFATDPVRMRAVIEDCFILLDEEKIDSLAPFVPALEAISGLEKTLLVIAEDLDQESLQTLLTNNSRKSLRCVAVKGPAIDADRREIFEDIAAATGGRVIRGPIDRKLGAVKLADLGRAKKVVVDRTTTTIIGGGGSKKEIDRRARMLRGAINRAGSDIEREKLEERLAKLVAEIAVVRVGGATEIDMKERKYLVENAIMAVRAALAEGVVPGGGVALLRAAKALDAVKGLPAEEAAALDLLRRALEEPARRIAANSGQPPAVVIHRLRGKNGAFGFNARSQRFEDLYKAGVVDPTRVVRRALESAASIAGSLLTAEAAVASGPPEPEKTYLDPPKVDPKNMKPRVK